MSGLRSPGKEHLHNVKWLPATLAGVKVFACAGTRVKAIAGMGEVSDRQANTFPSRIMTATTFICFIEICKLRKNITIFLPF